MNTLRLLAEIKRRFLTDVRTGCLPSPKLRRIYHHYKVSVFFLKKNYSSDSDIDILKHLKHRVSDDLWKN